ncbi:MazG nucleotide pyrophosphohydrolase domain protein [compost metagenome]
MQIKFEDMVTALIKPGIDILATLTPESVNLWHLGTGVGGEAGELLDAIKKYVAYNKPLDRENVIEELGDLMFYMEGIMQAINVSRDEVVAFNIQKLGKRYAQGYSDRAAQERADKND